MRFGISFRAFSFRASLRHWLQLSDPRYYCLDPRCSSYLFLSLPSPRDCTCHLIVFLSKQGYQNTTWEDVVFAQIITNLIQCVRDWGYNYWASWIQKLQPCRLMRAHPRSVSISLWLQPLSHGRKGTLWWDCSYCHRQSLQVPCACRFGICWIDAQTADTAYPPPRASAHW